MNITKLNIKLILLTTFFVAAGCLQAQFATAQVGFWANEILYTVLSSGTTGAPTASITYSTTAQTDQDVTATLVPSETVTVTNNNGLLTYTFKSNGSFTFEFINAESNTGSAIALVTNIIDRPGDINHNLTVDPQDAAIAKKILVGSELEQGQTVFKGSDVDSNKKSGLKEFIYILQSIIGIR